MMISLSQSIEFLRFSAKWEGKNTTASRHVGLLETFSSPVLPSNETKNAILQGLYGKDPKVQRAPASAIESEGYWDFYWRTCREVTEETFLDTHQDILDVAAQIRAGGTRGDIMEHFRTKTQHLGRMDQDRCLNLCIDLVLRLLTMSYVGIFQLNSGEKIRLEWLNSQTLTEMITSAPVLKAGTAMRDLHPGLERKFTALSLHRIAGLKIAWTWNMLDHLRLSEDENKAYIFSCLGVVHWQLDGGTPVIPRSILVEVQNTISMLLPSNREKVMSWYKQEAAKHDLDLWPTRYGVLAPEKRHIDSFTFFRDRLVILKQYYDQAEPSKPKQFLHDRRNGPQFFHICNSAIMLVLTIVTILSGGAQIYLSARQVKLAEH